MSSSTTLYLTLNIIENNRDQRKSWIIGNKFSKRKAQTQCASWIQKKKKTSKLSHLPTYLPTYLFKHTFPSRWVDFRTHATEEEEVRVQKRETFLSFLINKSTARYFLFHPRHIARSQQTAFLHSWTITKNQSKYFRARYSVYPIRPPSHRLSPSPVCKIFAPRGWRISPPSPLR